MCYQPITGHVYKQSRGSGHDVNTVQATRVLRAVSNLLLFVLFFTTASTIHKVILKQHQLSNMAQVCPVVGTTTTVLPPDHPSYDVNDPEARCPVTNAKVSPL